jgi:SpoIID/LytB domain protein
MKTFRRTVLFPTLGLGLLMVLGAQPAAASEDFRFDGRGWGHGVGMSQYGARALAEAGRSSAQILAHYYRGTSLGNVPSGTPHPWVGLLQNRSVASFRAVSGTTRAWDPSGASHTIPAGQTWTFRHVSGSQCRWHSPSGAVGSAGACRASVTSSGRVTVTDKGRTYQLGSNTALRLRPLPSNASRFHVSLEIPLERYVYGIAEVPAAWHMEALKAQAIAARSYAVHRLRAVGPASSFNQSRRNSCWCHLFDSVSDQVYIGWTRESVDRWRAAVNADRRVVTHSGGVAQTFYYSSSGGRTENNEDVWTGGSPISYLRSVDDPWSLDARAGNPNRSWSQNVRATTIASRAGLDRVLWVRVTRRNVSGSAAEVEIHGVKNGRETTVRRAGTWVRSTFGLRSTYITRIFLPPFVDDDGSIHREDIVWIADRGITRGCNPPRNDRFCPKDAVTREQMAAFLVRGFNLTRTTNKRFVDVPRGSTFENDINRLAAAGITMGCNPPRNDRYCPKDLVTRDQMAAFLVRAKGLTNANHPGFRDVPSGSTYDQDIRRLARAGITRGCNPPTNNRYCPRDAVTREQMASFLARALR